jgi:DNA (cytosine-5)-methyltransferase 1
VNELHLFAGAGGGILGGILLGHTCVCAVEIEPYCRRVLLQRQRDGMLPRFPIWDDVRTFDGTPWRGRVDIVCGGFPCQDISAAGKGAGIDGERSGLWGEMARIIGEVRPRFAFVENSPVLTSRGLGRVLGDLAAMGFDAEWGVLGADDAGAPHRRHRIWILAHAMQERDGGVAGKTIRADEAVRAYGDGSPHEVIDGGDEMPDADSEEWRGPKALLRHGHDFEGVCDAVPHAHSPQREGVQRPERGTEERTDAGEHRWWGTEPALGRVAHGVAHRVDRLAAIGNGQVPAVAALAWRTLGGVK